MVILKNSDRLSVVILKNSDRLSVVILKNSDRLRMVILKNSDRLSMVILLSTHLRLLLIIQTGCNVTPLLCGTWERGWPRCQFRIVIVCFKPESVHQTRDTTANTVSDQSGEGAVLWTVANVFSFIIEMHPRGDVFVQC